MVKLRLIYGNFCYGFYCGVSGGYMKKPSGRFRGRRGAFLGLGGAEIKPNPVESGLSRGKSQRKEIIHPRASKNFFPLHLSSRLDLPVWLSSKMA